MTSSLANEFAQHFYRKLGYKDIGSFLIETKGHNEPLELILHKELER
jgi:ribosomal protein S18 acetylase RimI-like enzyme